MAAEDEDLPSGACRKDKAMTTRVKIARQRDWDLYLKQNSEGQQDCQLVTAINAYYFLTGKTISQGTKRYESLRKLCKAVAGAAICIEKVHKRLGIKRGRKGWSPFSFGKKPKATLTLPAELTVWYKTCGFHSVLVVDAEPVTRSVRIPNMKWVTNMHGWVYWEDFQHYVKTQKEPPHGVWKFQSFDLVKKPTKL